MTPEEKVAMEQHYKNSTIRLADMNYDTKRTTTDYRLGRNAEKVKRINSVIPDVLSIDDRTNLLLRIEAILNETS